VLDRLYARRHRSLLTVGLVNVFTLSSVMRPSLPCQSLNIGGKQPFSSHMFVRKYLRKRVT
jgi:hypothetical protein